MDIRKLQSTGGSSLSVILPKKWIISHNLCDKEEVIITENYSGEINISPLKIKESKRYIAVDIDKIEPGAVINTLKALYKVGYDEITFTSKDFDHKNKSLIKKTITELLGFEAVEERSDKLLLKNLVDLERMPVGLMQQKAVSTTLSMLEDAVVAIKTNDMDLAQDIIERDSEVDKICLYIQRISYSMLTGRVSEREISIDSMRLNYYKEVVIQVERIADNAIKIARTIGVGGVLTDSDLEEFSKAAEKVLQITRDVFDLLISEKYKEINHQTERLSSIKKLTFFSEEDYQSGTFKEAVILGSLNRIRGQIQNIIETVNDYIIISY